MNVQDRNQLIGQMIDYGYYVDGPNAAAIVFKHKHIEPVIAALAQMEGDDPDDYTATAI